MLWWCLFATALPCARGCRVVRVFRSNYTSLTHRADVPGYGPWYPQAHRSRERFRNAHGLINACAYGSVILVRSAGRCAQPRSAGCGGNGTETGVGAGADLVSACGSGVGGAGDKTVVGGDHGNGGRKMETLRRDRFGFSFVVSERIMLRSAQLDMKPSIFTTVVPIRPRFVSNE
jgi:hypothetical protein